MRDNWRFNPNGDMALSGDKKQNIETWINVDAPIIGSMRMIHEADCTMAEAIRRAKLAVYAPEMLAELGMIASIIEDSDSLAEAISDRLRIIKYIIGASTEA